MAERNATLRSVAWTEIFPWLSIFRVFRTAISFRVLLLGATGMFLMLNAWALLAMWFGVGTVSANALWMAPADGCPWVAIDLAAPDRLVGPDMMGMLPATAADEERLMLMSVSDVPWVSSPLPLPGVWRQLNQPVVAAFSPQTDLTLLLCLFLCALSSLAIWAFFGGAIARIAAVQFASDERVGLFAALRFACRKWLSFFTAPLVPMTGIIAAAVPVWLLGFLLRADIGILLVSLIWPLLLLFGLIMALLLIGLLFSWPLMWGTIAAEGTDSFDAISRSYAYLFQRPLHYLFYVIVAAVLGAVGWFVVQYVAAGIVGLTYWAASWGAGTQKIAQMMPGGEGLEGVGLVGAWIVRFWATCVKTLAVGFLYGYFWAAVTGVYFLLRRDVDATETDEIHLDADAREQMPPLPPITTDAQGAPVMDEGNALEDDVPRIVTEEPPAERP
jgi:hypothetical protein